MKHSLQRKGRSFFATMLLGLSPIALAGSFQVSPVRVHLSEAAPTAAIRIVNDSTTDEVVLQLRATSWTQQAGEDVYTPSTELIATPPIFTMKPGASQTVRVGLRKVVPGELQQSFRLYITEVPPPPKEGFTGLQVSLNISIPVFVAPKVASGGPPIWRAKMVGRVLEVSASNPGNSHVQIIEASLTDQQNANVAAIPLTPRYILGKQTITWQLPVSQAPVGKLRLVARTDVPSAAIDVLMPVDVSPTAR